MAKAALLCLTLLLLSGCIYTSPPYGCPLACNYQPPLEPGYR